MSPIQPPERTSSTGAVLVVVLISLFTLVFHLPDIAVWLLAAVALLTATAILLRLAPAIHSGLLGLLVLIVATFPVMRDLWPLSALLAV